MTNEEFDEILERTNAVVCNREWYERAAKVLEQEQKYCGRNICISNEYNGIGCDECEVTKSQEKILEPSEDGMEKHTDRQIYDGCIHLMRKMVDYFQEYLEYLGYDLDLLDEDERFGFGISNMEIVRWLFLFHTRNSGGCSTRDFCEKIGIDDSEVVKFEFERYEE